ncbi:oligoendopeptidase F [Lactobacillus paragasseri]|uniref:oligoendopeptidase F n=1 Tax=Lactobacillus paragasseri TaxID=2107999 RepID=UPI0012E2085B|nr:oligoendopeptidase F [Lactobacillus paragasseri]MDK8086795.1 oligoendopeptidase F [Lactobacillus paragasseri]MDX5118671.1 oligoendopeptidase F [Lactobacillus paragasseri]MDX5122608.1 oligoendopeptidase F [Lactobacillus paragasseri]QGT98373.1 oligoendopeptidase F [Lactobacillus paragasseri]UWI47792.1 oligoendopeptidase F [Lactobacillus paragasseri]
MALPTRNEVSDDLKWDLSRVFKNNQEWEQEYKQVAQEIKNLSKFKGTLAKSGKDLYEGITVILAVNRRLEKVYVYATMSSDVDTSNNHYLGFVAKAQSLANQMSAAIAFVDPEILSIPEETLAKFMQDEPRLENYRHRLEQITQKRPHTLPANEEKIIADAGDAMGTSANTFNVLTNSDMEYGYVQDEDGEMVQLSDGLYSLLIQSQDRNVRKNAFDVMYASYGQFENSLASTLSGEVKAHNFNARVHKYNSAREAALSENSVPTAVYDTLIKEVNSHLDLLHRYVALRKKILGLKDLQMYDMYVPLTGKPVLSYNFEEAKEEARKALAPLGEDYLKHVDYIFNNRVIDVVENQNKVTGAYSGGAYDTDPYELLNWEDNLDSLYTLVHETGHSVHSWYTRNTQPYVYGDYPIFVAEIASTTNENILTEYFLDKITDPKTRAFVLNHYLDSFKGTLFRQTQFAEFEQFIHETDANGQPLTADVLDEFYGNLNQRYYGDSVEPGGEIAMEWSRIPHFYYNFYVYQYATGFAAATALANKVVHGTEQERDAYINFLKSGSSDYPTEIMKRAGVDMTRADYLRDAFDTFEKRLNEFEKIVDELNAEK